VLKKASLEREIGRIGGGQKKKGEWHTEEMSDVRRRRGIGFVTAKTGP